MPSLSKSVVACIVLLSGHLAHAGAVLDKVHAARSLACGVIKEEEDYSRATDHGNRAAFDLDMCKAIAVAALGVGAHFTISVYPDEPTGIQALKTGAIDLLPSASPTLTNMADGLSFGPTTFHDGESLLIPNNPAVHSAADLAGMKICFVITSGSETGLRVYAARHNISYIWYPFSEVGEMEAAFFTKNCAALAGDVSQLANTRAINRTQASAYTILPEIFQEDPLAPAYKTGDVQFGLIVNWTVEALIEAEELGVTRGNVQALAKGQDPIIDEWMGRPLGTGKLLGVDTHWTMHVVEAVGNYGEMFDRDLGAASPLRIDRGANRLWTMGGVMIARRAIQP